ncbi:MAG: hypothetical protein ACRD2X_14360 [Vicinamibacteraceae bacterium]
MPRTTADRATPRGILLFVSIAYALSIAFSLIVALTGGYQSRFAFPCGVAAMFVPTIAVMIVSSTMSDGVWSFGWNRFPLRYLPIALLLMPLVLRRDVTRRRYPLAWITVGRLTDASG